MRNKAAEAKLMMIGERYYKKMWDQSIIQESQESQESLKETHSQIQSQKRQIRENTTVQHLNRPRQIQNKISRCLNFNTEIKEKENEKEKEEEVPECNEESQKEEKSNKTNSEFMKEVIIQHQASQHDESEDVIYSEGASLEELYPDNTWDSDDALYDDKHQD